MKILFESPLNSLINKHKKKYVDREFPFLEHSNIENYLSFFPYTTIIPWKFYDKAVFVSYYEYLRKLPNSNFDELRKTLNAKWRDLNLAFKYLYEINMLNIHDDLMPHEEIDRLLFIDNNIHPNLLKLSEGVYSTFLSFLTHFVFIKEGKGTVAAEKISSCVEKLRKTEFASIVEFYSLTIRNGIAHRDITFESDGIIYKDDKGNEEYKQYSDIIKYFDQILDICNGIALGFRLFFMNNLNLFKDNAIITPSQIMFQEVIENVNNRRWEVKDFFEMEIGEKKQLMMLIETKHWNYSSALYMAMHTAVLTEKFASGYDRYFLNLKCKYAMKGWAGFDGKRLTELRSKNSNNLEEYAQTLEGKGIFFIPRFKLPHFFNTIDTFLSIFKDNFKYEAEDIKLKLNKPIVDCKYLTLHRNGFYCVIRGNIILLNVDENIVDTIYSKLDYIVKKIIKEAKRQKNIFSIARYFPAGYIRVGIYTSDMRKRDLYWGGLPPELFCEIELKKISRMKVPDLLNCRVSKVGRYKIFWHNEWGGIKNISHNIIRK